MDPTLYIVLSSGTLLMLAVMLYCRKFYPIPIWKAIASGLLLTVSGTLGALIMYYIEAGGWGGQSFYGAVFFAPFMMTLAALILRIPCANMLDLCAPAECIMLAVLKVNCLRNGCCHGCILWYNASENPICFPSQLAEIINSLALMVILLWFMKAEKNHGKLYAWYLLLYGATRFILNFFRADQTPFVWVLPAGHFWSLCAVAIGIVWLLLAKHNRKTAAAE